MLDWAKIKRRLAQHLWLGRLTALGLGLAVVFWLSRLATPVVKAGINWLNPVIRLESFKNRTNILLLGIGGAGHEGADLTDSLMLVSVNLLTGDTVIISLPRDIWVESLQAKLNTAYHYGEAKQVGGGLILAKAAAAEILNQPVHYGVVWDFSGLERAINILGGIDLNVPRGFVDKLYPIPGQEAAEPEAARYETVVFKPGKQHFDGAQALKYVRSRRAEGEEGTDYARAQRQQLAILAFKDKLLNPSTWLNWSKLKQLKNEALTSLVTDLPAKVYPETAKLVLKIDREQIRTGVLDQGSQSEDIPPLLYNPPVSRFGQWVLLPAGDDWNIIYRYLDEILYQNQSLVMRQ